MANIVLLLNGVENPLFITNLTNLFLKNTVSLLGELVEPMSINYNATLELADIKMELFRVKRYYNDFTHLQYDCEYGWPYEWVAHTISTASLVLAILLVVNFTYRFYKDKEPNNNES